MSESSQSRCTPRKKRSSESSTVVSTVDAMTQGALDELLEVLEAHPERVLHVLRFAKNDIKTQVGFGGRL